MKNLAMITLFFSLMLGLGSCVMEDVKETKTTTTESSFRNDKFYFKRYTKVSEADSAQVMNVNYYDNGHIELYGEIIRFKKTSETDMYKILDEKYDINEQTYTFTCDRAVIVFSVLDKSFTINFMNSDDKEVFYVDSEIKTNW